MTGTIEQSRILAWLCVAVALTTAVTGAVMYKTAFNAVEPTPSASADRPGN